MTAPDLAKGVAETLAPVLSPLHLIVEDVTVTAAGKRRLVQVLVDSDLSSVARDDRTSEVDPLSLDEVAEASRVIDAALDDLDVMGAAPYVLEVSSTGLSRALTEPRHFRRNVGRLVELTMADAAAPSVTGRLIEAGLAGDGDLVIEVPATKKEPARIETVPADSVRKGVVQVEFNRPTKDTHDTQDNIEDTADAADGSPREVEEDL